VALDRELNRKVALKEINPRHADDPEYRSRLVQEAEITGNLEHPGVVPVYGLGRDVSGRPRYAMQLIHGTTLKKAAAALHRPGVDEAERRQRLRELLRRLADVCLTVAYAHTATSSRPTSCSATSARASSSTGAWPSRSAAPRGRPPRPRERSTRHRRRRAWRARSRGRRLT
jgi:serine/threonine protein kinase